MAKKHINTKFHTPKANVCYDQMLSDKGFIPDKGFHAACRDNHTALLAVTQVVAALKWTEFCSPYSILDSDIIHEFYANLWATQSTTVRVRGKIVPLTAQPLMACFNYQTMLRMLTPPCCPKSSKPHLLKYCKPWLLRAPSGPIWDFKGR